LTGPSSIKTVSVIPTEVEESLNAQDQQTDLKRCLTQPVLSEVEGLDMTKCNLDSDATFCLDRNVPVDEDQASGNPIAPTTQDGAVAFATTHWSVVLTAQGPTAAAQAALDKLCRTYWRPIYGFVRREGTESEEAKDLTQGFFALLLERRDLNMVRQEKGRLRSYLLTSLKHFLTNEHYRGMAIKRGEGQRLIRLEDLRERERIGFEPADTSTAEQIYERRWALALLDQVLTRLGDEYRAAGNVVLFERLKALLTDEPDRPSQAQIADELAMTENAVKQAFHRMRERYRQLLREEIAHTVMVPGDIEDELRHLIAVLRA
jgi:RNA polymerase sigma-70 factor (ECF subfamily)